jgi:hypothetical protein
MERESLRLMIVSMSASEDVADRAIVIKDWILGKVTSICPMASEVLDALIDVKIEADAEATCFALAAMAKCLQRRDPDGALYLFLKMEDVREVLERERRQCPRSRDSSVPPPANMPTPAGAIGIVNTKREKLGDCFYQAAQEKKKEKEKEKNEKGAEGSQPPRRRPTWIFDGEKIVGSTEPTEEKPQPGDKAELQFGIKFLVLHDKK